MSLLLLLLNKIAQYFNFTLQHWMSPKQGTRSLVEATEAAATACTEESTTCDRIVELEGIRTTQRAVLVRRRKNDEQVPAYEERVVQPRRPRLLPVIRQSTISPRYLVDVCPFSFHEIVLPCSRVHISIRKCHLAMARFFPVHVITLEDRLYLNEQQY